MNTGFTNSLKLLNSYLATDLVLLACRIHDNKLVGALSSSAGIKYNCLVCVDLVVSPSITCPGCSVHSIAELMCCQFFLNVQCDLLVLTYHSSNKVVHLHSRLPSMFGALGILQYTWKSL